MKGTQKERESVREFALPLSLPPKELPEATGCVYSLLQLVVRETCFWTDREERASNCQKNSKGKTELQKWKTE
jgi:hypothetical protein